jgi:thiol-disulfide isomerase/thioredoxin
MKKMFLVVLQLLPVLLTAQPDLFRHQNELIGTTISDIKITDYLLNEPTDKNYNNKFKVLEFWATWCKPCLAAVPHLNKLQQKFGDQNIVFLSFTNESPAKTAPTLQRVKFETIVVSDQTKTIHKTLNIEHDGTMGLPRTVLIDDENKIVWYGTPNKLTSQLIEKFLKKQPLTK